MNSITKSIVLILVAYFSTLYAYNIEGVVVDVIRQTPIEGATLTMYEGAILVGTYQTSATGRIEIDGVDGHSYRLIVSKKEFLSTTQYNVLVNGAATNNLGDVPLINVNHCGPGTASGTVRNAVNNTTIQGVQVNIREGLGQDTGAVAFSATSTSGGGINLSGIATGVYSAEYLHIDYTTVVSDLVVIGGFQAPLDQMLSPVLPVGAARIVLTWGSSPSDLDSHLENPVDSPIYYFHKTINGALLDFDEIMGYGPETITITTQYPGVYRYHVYDFTNKNSSASTALGNSGAKVELYIGGRLDRTLHVPAGVGKLWTVFELEAGNVTLINTLTNGAGPTILPGGSAGYHVPGGPK